MCGGSGYFTEYGSDRFPVVWDVLTTDVTGNFGQEVTLQEADFDACVTVPVEPFEEHQGTSNVVEAGLRLRKPAAPVASG